MAAKPITPEYLARSGTEHGEQMALFCWAAQNKTKYRVLEWMFAIPNGGGRSIAQAAGLIAEGVKRGVADVSLPVPMLKYAGLYIEMKRATGVPSDVSDEQYKFGAFVTLHRYHWQVCFGWAEAVVCVQAYLGGYAYSLSENQLKVSAKLFDYYAALRAPQ